AEASGEYLRQIDALLGIVGIEAPEAEGEEDAAFADEVEALLREREEARAARDWPRADSLRDAIDALGVIVMDTPSGPTWRRA
ncbi:MAG: cysteine--tRNA ligase, partial [Bacteroidota bacterium]